MEENRFKRVDDYLDGVLSDEEAKVFEEDLRSCESLQKRLRFAKLERRIITGGHPDEKVRKIAAWNRAYHRRRRLTMIGTLSIFVILLVLGSIWLHRYTNRQDANPLLALYERPNLSSPTEETVRMNGREELESLDVRQKYLQAHQYFAAGQYKRAEDIFREVASDVNFGLDAEWYAVLCHYLWDQRITAVIPRLENILQDEKHPHFDDARNLKRLLEKRSE
jgi:hypothetical protein